MTRLVSALYNDAGPFLSINTVNSFAVSQNPDELSTNDILLLHGGEDISPSLYNHEVHPYTGARSTLSKRDAVEWALLQRAIELEIPIVGICRGLQIMCAAAGGYLIQHVDNHGGYHNVIDADGEEFEVNSVHHQMVYPFDIDHRLLAWVEKKRSRVHLVGSGRSITDALPCEPEAVAFPSIRAIGFQFHPEYGTTGDRYVDWSVEQVNKFINERL